MAATRPISRTELPVPDESTRAELAYWLGLPEITAVEWLRWSNGYQADLDRLREEQVAERVVNSPWTDLRDVSMEWN